MKDCEICNKPFHPWDAKSKFCSRQCYTKNQNNKRRAYKHKWHLRNMGREEPIPRTSKERWIHSVNGYVMVKVNGNLVYEHRVLAEKALGKPLPPKAIVHHTGRPDDNHGFCKLVICPDQTYHNLIHKRMRVLGYANS